MSISSSEVDVLGGGGGVDCVLSLTPPGTDLTIQEATFFIECLVFYLWWKLSDLVKVMQALLANWKGKQSCFNCIEV